MPSEWSSHEWSFDEVVVLFELEPELRRFGVRCIPRRPNREPTVQVPAELERYVRARVAVRMAELGLEGDRPAPTSNHHGSKPRGTLVPVTLVEKALQIHERDNLGRRRLYEKIPGLTDHQARQILRWHKVGEPAGLWLDKHDRVKWGPGISPTPAGLRLPAL